MKRYRFRLEHVLRVRRTEEDLARGALLRANLDLRRKESALEQAVRRRIERRGVSGPVPAADYLADRFLDERLADAVREASHARDAAAVGVDQARDAWAAAAQKVSVLERLDERRRAEHRLASERQESTEVDDVVVGRFRRTA